MLANSAATLPPGHVLAESYLYDQATGHSNGFGSLTYLLYGLADGFTVGLTPTAGFNQVRGGPSSSGVGLGDITLQTQYRLTRFDPAGWIPATALSLQETLPTGRYDRLGDRPSNGLGAGAYTTTVGLYSQTYLWMPNGRILRLRLDATQAFSDRVNVEGVSVYGTGAGFHGHALPGDSSFVDGSVEYSLSRSWVLALDVTYRHNADTRVSGYDILGAISTPPPSVRQDSGSSDTLGFAPAIEYSWTPNLGALIGARFIPAGHNTVASITPAVAINYVY